MDFSKFKTHDWLVVGGGAAVLIFTFLKWWKVDLGPFGSVGTNGFDHFLTGIVPWILIVGTAVLTFLAVAGIFKLPANLQAPLIFVGTTALGALLILLNLLTSPGTDGADRGIGLYLSLIGAIVATVGAVMSFQASGGNLNDLKDPNKLKGAFGGNTGGNGGDLTPPPPPPPSV